MSVIKITCVDQVLTFTNTPVIASGGIREDSIEFTFCSQWDGFEKVAVFVKNTEMMPPALINADGRCEIPYDVLAEAGRFYIGVFGVNADGVRRTTEYLEYMIVEGAVASVEGLEEFGAFEQLLQQLGGKQDALKWDTAPTAGSRNAVNSDAVYQALQGRVPTTRKVNGKPLSSDITISAEDISGMVPTTRKVNGKPLSSDITLAVDDISGAVPNTRKVNGKALSADLALTAEDFELETSGTVTDAGWGTIQSYTLKRNNFAKVCFFNMQINIAKNATNAEWYTLATVAEGFRPASKTALACSIVRNNDVVIGTDGVIQIRFHETNSASNTYYTYISGFWFI